MTAKNADTDPQMDDPNAKPEAGEPGAEAPEGASPDALDEAAAGSEAPDEGAPAGAEAASQDVAAELDEMRDKLMRAVADAENTRKRAQREIKETREYAVTGFARDMLDVADNLSRALASVDDEAKADAGPALATLLEGVELTEKRLLSTLERHGVKKVEPEPGAPFDPNRHQAAANIPSDQPKGRIAHAMQPGYVIGERTLRAAMVVVSAGPAEGGGEAKDDTPPKPEGGVDVTA